MSALLGRMSLRSQLATFLLVTIVGVAVLILIALRASTFQAFIDELHRGLRPEPFQQTRRQRSIDLARMARILASDAAFVRNWRNRQLDIAHYVETVAALEPAQREHPSDLIRSRLKAIRKANFRELWEMSQRVFFDQDAQAANWVGKDFLGAAADLFLVVDSNGVILIEFTTGSDPAQPKGLGKVEVDFPLANANIPEPHALLVGDQPLFKQAYARLDRGEFDRGAAGYFAYADGHLYQAIAMPTVAGGLVVLGDRVDDKFASQASLYCGGADAVLLGRKGPEAATEVLSSWLESKGPLEGWRSEEVLNTFRAGGFLEGPQEIKVGGENYVAFLSPLDPKIYSIPEMTVVANVPQPPGWLALMKPTRIVDELAGHQILVAIGAVSAAALLGLLLSWGLAGQIARPIQQLSSSLLQVGQGDLEVTLQPQGPRDVYLAGVAFNQMLLGLRDHETLEKFVRRLEQLRQAVDLSDPLVRDQAQFGRYIVVSKLGAGGMATVYKALPADTLDESQRVAIKLMHAHLDDRPRLEREYRVMILLSHPGVARVLDAGDQQGRFYIAMEFVEGVPLTERMRKPVSFEEFNDFARQLLAAVGYAHGQNVIHRDLKPDNVMVTSQGLKVMDFGLAAGLEMTRLTASGDVLGTPAYVAPEQLMGAPPDRQADQYSLGIVFYEMIAGHLPFPAEDLSMLMHAHLNSAPPPLVASRPDVPASIEAVILRMLAKSPSQRFPDLAAVATALSQQPQ